MDKKSITAEFSCHIPVENTIVKSVVNTKNGLINYTIVENEEYAKFIIAQQFINRGIFDESTELDLEFIMEQTKCDNSYVIIDERDLDIKLISNNKKEYTFSLEANGELVDYCGRWHDRDKIVKKYKVKYFKNRNKIMFSEEGAISYMLIDNKEYPEAFVRGQFLYKEIFDLSTEREQELMKERKKCDNSYADIPEYGLQVKLISKKQKKYIFEVKANGKILTTCSTPYDYEQITKKYKVKCFKNKDKITFSEIKSFSQD
jgi:hypothetical protein